MGEPGGVVGVKIGFKLLGGNGRCTIVSIRGTGLEYYCKYIKFIFMRHTLNNLNRLINRICTKNL